MYTYSRSYIFYCFKQTVSRNFIKSELILLCSFELSVNSLGSCHWELKKSQLIYLPCVCGLYSPTSMLTFYASFCILFILFLQIWSDSLIKLAYSLAQLNGSAIMFLQKAHTKLCLQVDKSGRIPVKK